MTEVQKVRLQKRQLSIDVFKLQIKFKAYVTFCNQYFRDFSIKWEILYQFMSKSRFFWSSKKQFKVSVLNYHNCKKVLHIIILSVKLITNVADPIEFVTSDYHCTSKNVLNNSLLLISAPRGQWRPSAGRYYEAESKSGWVWQPLPRHERHHPSVHSSGRQV